MATPVVKPNLTATSNGYFVRCSVWPLYLPADGKRRQMGYEVELLGSHSADPGHLDPGCLACRRMRAELLAIAEAVVGDTRTSSEGVIYEISAHGTSIVCSQKLENRPLVTVSIYVLHHNGVDTAAEQSEASTINRIKRHLAKFGIRER